MNGTTTRPPAWIGYHEEVDGDVELCMFEGEYSRDSVLDPEQCVGMRFEMDGMLFEVVGDLSGHIAYRRENTAAIYTLSWVRFEDHVMDGVIEIRYDLSE